MSARTNFDELLTRTVQHTGQDETAARLAIMTFLEEIYQSMKHGESVTIQNFGGLYVRPERDTRVFKFNPLILFIQYALIEGVFISYRLR